MTKETRKFQIHYQLYWFIHFFSQATRRIIKTSVQFTAQQDTLGACLQTDKQTDSSHPDLDIFSGDAPLKASCNLVSLNMCSEDQPPEWKAKCVN